MAINGSLTEKATEYFNGFDDLKGKVPPAMLVDFVIEKFKQHRNYPDTFSEEKIETDLMAHLSTMAMAVVDLYVKAGAEGEKAHNENGISRTYENAYVSTSIFSDVLPFVKVL